ncbi:transmembrane protein [Cystoisospora suis]|uniref:Transmembrane protein n=1 Tax=Cystoisospora suis TaxID=483139 RepID=A0A2C6LBL7_9APIC|nr:transmembrane protein [Cystoisospora suis]
MTLPQSLNGAPKWRFFCSLFLYLPFLSSGDLPYSCLVWAPSDSLSRCRAGATLLLSHLLPRVPGDLSPGVFSQDASPFLSFLVKASAESLEVNTSTSIPPSSWRKSRIKTTVFGEGNGSAEKTGSREHQKQVSFDSPCTSQSNSDHGSSPFLGGPLIEGHRSSAKSAASSYPQGRETTRGSSFQAPVSSTYSLPSSLFASSFGQSLLSPTVSLGSSGSDGFSKTEPCPFSSPARPLSFLMETDQQKAGGVPRACSYARCASGQYTPRHAHDIQQCYTFSTCSRCPRHAESHGDICSQVEERSGMLLLLRSTITSMQAPVEVFHFKPLTAEELQNLKRGKTVPSPQVEGGGPGGGVAPGGGEEGSVDEGEEGGWNDWDEGGGESYLELGKSSFLLSSSHSSALPSPLSTSLGDEAASSSPRVSLLEESAAWDQDEYGYDMDENVSYNRDAMVGRYGSPGRGKSSSQQGAGAGGSSAAGKNKGMFLRFDERKVYRISPTSPLADIGRCATNSKNYMQLLVTIAFQPRRFSMSLSESRRLLGFKPRAVGGSGRGGGGEGGGSRGGGGSGASGYGGEEDYEDDNDASYQGGGGFLEENFKKTSDGNNSLSGRRRSLQKESDKKKEGKKRGGVFFSLNGPLKRGEEGSFIRGGSSYLREKNSGRPIEKHHQEGGEIALDDSAVSSYIQIGDRNQIGRGEESLSGFSFLQGDYEDDYGDEDDDEEGGRGIKAKMKGFFGGVKRVFSRKKSAGKPEDEFPPEEGEDYGEEGMGEEGGGPRKGGGYGPSSGGGKKKGPGFFRRLFKRKSKAERMEAKQTKQAKKLIQRTPKLNIQVTFDSPAVKGCRKPVDWTGYLDVNSIFHVSFFIRARQAEVGKQLAAFINSSLTLSLECMDKEGCTMNETPHSCAMVSCVKAKQGSAEALQAGKQAAAQSADLHLKEAAEKSALLFSDEERARRAAEYAKALEEKHAEAHAGHKLTTAEQELLLQQQLAALQGAPHGGMQAKLLEAMMGGAAGGAQSRLGMEMKHAGEEGFSPGAGAAFGNMPMEDATGASSEAVRAAMERMLMHGGDEPARKGISTGAIVALVFLGLLATALVGMIAWKYIDKNRLRGWQFRGRMPFTRR